MDYEREDKAALHNALLNMHVCPRCRADLLPVAQVDNVMWCKTCDRHFAIPPED